jgi:hypothetical protein
MADEPENLVLLLLRKIDGKLDRLVEDVADLKRRSTSLELTVADMGRQVASIHGDFAGQSMRIDRLEARLERIERRLELTH